VAWHPGNAVNPYESRQLLKRDRLGTAHRLGYMAAGGARDCVERDPGAAQPGLGWIARRLAAREARTLSELSGFAHVPELVSWDGGRLRRSWLEGAPLHRAHPRDPTYFREALRLLRSLHARGIVHNGTGDAANWLVDADQRPGLVEFRFALRMRRDSAVFRALAYDDLRDLLAVKSRLGPQRLTRRQRALLASRPPLAALWAWTAKPVYRLLSRRLPPPTAERVATDIPSRPSGPKERI